MRIAPHKSLPQATLILTLLFAGYPLARQATPVLSAHYQPTPLRSPTHRRDTSQTSQIDLTHTPKSGDLSAGKSAAIGAPMPQIRVEVNKERSMKVLLKTGPAFLALFNMSNFEVKAAARGGWPVVVVYELPQPGVVTLTIKADKVAPFVQQLKGTPGRHEVLFNIPEHFGKKVQAGSYSLVAVSDESSAAKPIELRLYGIGAGDKAVGSLGIDRVVFRPDRVVTTPKTGKAEYSFHSLFDFDKVSADFRLVHRVNGVLDTRLVADKKMSSIIRDAWHSGEWNCRAGNKVSKGLHQLHVRAWQSGGPWVTSISEQFVEVQ